MDVDNWVKKCRDLDVEGSRCRGRPRKTWDEVVRRDLKVKAIHRDLARDRWHGRKPSYEHSNSS